MAKYILRRDAEVHCWDIVMVTYDGDRRYVSSRKQYSAARNQAERLNRLESANALAQQ